MSNGMMLRGKTLVSESASAVLLAGAVSADARTAHASEATAASAALSDFASQVETLGETSYGNSFTGAVVSNGGVDVYADPATDSGLSSAISSLDTAGYPVAYHSTTLSYNALDALNNKLGDVQSQLQAAGVQISQSAPDPTSDSVAVTLVPPTSSDLALLRSAAQARRLPHATADSYTSAASAIIKSIAGSGYTVQSQTLAPAASAPQASASPPPAGRGSGVRPFAGGDEIQGPTSFCTSGFGVVGNKSGYPFVLTAGHCGRGTWSTPAQTMGQTSSLYFMNPAEDDFQTIRVGTTVSANIAPEVNGNSQKYAIVGEDIPAFMSRITVDGALTGERNDQTVVANNARVYVHNPNGPNYYAQHEVVVTGTPAVCQGGDSGGPMFLRTNNGNAKAVTTIVAYYPQTLNRCAGERISVEEANSNTHLLLSGG